MDYIGIEEGISYIIKDWVVPYVVNPIISRLDDVMDNIVRSFGMKNFGTHYDGYWTGRKEDNAKIIQELKERNKFYGGESPDDNIDTNKEVVQKDGKVEKSGVVPMENLERFTAQLGDVVGDMVRENDEESGDGVKRDFSNMQKSFEENPDSFIKRSEKPSEDVNQDIALEFPDEISSRVEEVEKAKKQSDSLSMSLPMSEDAGELESFRDIMDSPPPTEGSHTIWGDKKLTSSDFKSEEDFLEQGKKRLSDMKEDKDNPYAWGSSGEYAMALVQERIKACGYNSLDDMVKKEGEVRAKDEALRNRMQKEKLNSINKQREKSGVPLLSIDKIPKVTNDEFEEWKKKRNL